MKNQRIPNYKNLSSEEKKLFNIYLSEYNDIFQSILLFTPTEFIQNIIKRVEITLKKKFNDIPLKNKKRVEEFLTEKIYSKEFKLASNAMKIIKKRKNENYSSKTLFKGEIIEHCPYDKKNGYYIHSCGEKFYVFKYKPLINFTNLEEEPKNDIFEFFLVCPKCEMLYKSNLIKFHCNDSNIDFYSKFKNENDKNNELPFATWKKYHCNAVINDTMKCPICKESLLYDKENDKLICKKCNKNVAPKKILWNCLICKTDFSSEAKEYNNLEFKNMKICIKDTLINKERAFPEIMGCDCEIDFEKNKFFHKITCKGELFLGEMNGRKIVVCYKCDSMGFYDNYNWTCPKCQKKFKVKNILKNNDSINNYSNNIINRNLSSRKEKENNEDEFQYKSGKKYFGFSPCFKRKRSELDESCSPNKNNLYRSSIKKDKKEDSRSPFIMLKKQLSGVNDDEVKNLGNDFNNISLRDERPETENNLNFKNSLYDKINERNKKRKKSLNKNSVSTTNSSENGSLKIERNKKEKENQNSKFIILKEIIPEEEKKKFDVNDYKIKEQIGEGSFGKIFKVESQEGKYYAMKKIVATNQSDIEDLQHEYDILDDVIKSGKKIDLVSIIGKQNKQLDPTTFVLYVIMDLADCDWEKEVEERKKKNKYYSEKQLFKILFNLIKTFSQLQRINISHRDIKPQNVLFFKENNSYKLADFGEAKELQNNGLVTSRQTLRGTELFMSPVLFQAYRNKKKYIKSVNHNTYKSDVYSFGLMALHAASLGYDALYDIRELKNNFSVRVVLEKYLKNYYSPLFIDLIASMLDVDEKARCDFVELEKVFQDFEKEF